VKSDTRRIHYIQARYRTTWEIVRVLDRLENPLSLPQVGRVISVHIVALGYIAMIQGRVQERIDSALRFDKSRVWLDRLLLIYSLTVKGM